jgi:hypothetical protein
MARAFQAGSFVPATSRVIATGRRMPAARKPSSSGPCISSQLSRFKMSSLAGQHNASSINFSAGFAFASSQIAFHVALPIRVSKR